MNIIQRLFTFANSIGDGKRALVNDDDHVFVFIPTENIEDLVYCNTDEVAIPTLDGLTETGRLKVNPVVGQAGVEAGAGNSTSKTQRVVIATNQPAFTVKLDAALAGTVVGATVSTTAVMLADEDSGRKLFQVTNNGPGVLYIGFDATVTASGATMGQAVNPLGCLTLDRFEWLGQVWGIYSEVSASQNVSVLKTTSTE